MIYIEQFELIYKSGDVLYLVKIIRKLSGKIVFYFVLFGLNKIYDFLEVEDVLEVIWLVIDECYFICCSIFIVIIMNKKGK